MIDEILAVGDEAFQKKCIEKILSLKKQGKTMVVVSHNMALMEKITDRIIYIKEGKIVESA